MSGLPSERPTAPGEGAGEGLEPFGGAVSGKLTLRPPLKGALSQKLRDRSGADMHATPIKDLVADKGRHEVTRVRALPQVVERGRGQGSAPVGGLCHRLPSGPGAGQSRGATGTVSASSADGTFSADQRSARRWSDQAGGAPGAGRRALRSSAYRGTIAPTPMVPRSTARRGSEERQPEMDGLGQCGVGIIARQLPDHGAAEAPGPDVERLLQQHQWVIEGPQGGAVE